MLQRALLLCLFSGCASANAMVAITSGQTGCAPDAIMISEEDGGWGSITWRADCDGRVYRCSGVSAGKGAQYMCAEARGTQPAVVPPAATAAAFPPARPASEQPAPAKNDGHFPNQPPATSGDSAQFPAKAEAKPTAAASPPAHADCTKPTAELFACQTQCDKESDVDGCHRSAVTLEAAKDKVNALGFYRKACALGNQNDCRRVKLLTGQ
jgi:hypothetical protein